MDICSFVFLSLGPVGPRGGGIYSIIEDVVCQAYVLRTGLKPNNCGCMQFRLCVWALSGPGVGYIQLLRTVCVKYICLKLAWKPNMMDMYVKLCLWALSGPGWGIFNY